MGLPDAPWTADAALFDSKTGAWYHADERPIGMCEGDDDDCLFSHHACRGGIAFVLGVAVDKTSHDYHQTHVKDTDRPAYGRAFAKGVFAISAALLVSGMIAPLGGRIASPMALLVGLTVSVVMFAKAQKKYHGGIF